MNANSNSDNIPPVVTSNGCSEISEIEARHASRLTNFAHDLRSPLTSILTGIEVLKISLGNADQSLNIIEMLERQTREMVSLLDGLVRPDDRA